MDYLKRAARYARSTYNTIRKSADYYNSHNSFAVRDALLKTEKRFTDLGTFGVEYIAKGHNSKSPSITYLNSGDTYTLTILYVRGQFRVGCWGNIVERGRYD